MLSCHGAQSSDVYAPGSRAATANRRRYLQNNEDMEEEFHEEEPSHQEEPTHHEEHEYDATHEEDHEYDVDAPQPSQATQPTQGNAPQPSRKGKAIAKTPGKKGRKKTWNTQFHSPEYPHKLIPIGMQRYKANTEAEEEAYNEEEEEETSEEEEPTLATMVKRGRRK